MSTLLRKQFLTKHAKSSAALISLGIHAVLIVLALSFVAVTVIQKDDQVFEAVPVKRPNIRLKKLQVPVNIKRRKTQKPKLRKRIVVQPKLNQVMPDIKMPEITGLKGGMGNAAGAGLGGAGGLGFSMPEMKLFGVKSRGEKVFIILDASGFMMTDKMGGIPAYTIIKSELVRILEGLNSTVLFNIAIYGGGDVALFPSLVPANAENVAKVGEWLKPLNAVTKGMGDKDYGAKTRGKGGVGIGGDLKVEPLTNTPGDWARPALLGMRQQADVVFLLTCRWGLIRGHAKTRSIDWSESDEQRFKENVAKAKSLFRKDNSNRRAKGKPPRVIAGGDNALLRAYVPSARLKPSSKTFHNYSPKEMAEAFGNIQAERKAEALTKSGVGEKGKNKFSFNVIHFVSENAGSGKEEKFVKLTNLTHGEYSRVKGMAAIQSYVSENVE
ncbi:vWA domain-containing protein [Pontiella sulfatireligans]|uniref:VWFA domain-containing protein n=1 Tax=Pontiella sulfatireligans TaxID=2750658 RepID=A0A6C2UFE3_9BACT|nr:hypothetical protein [Pontiella sulfatireligans]VGO18865.1 hypothetical protein SCARR_00918 [Pontiella sulfatireligans]